jgi:hypothetical protein
MADDKKKDTKDTKGKEKVYEIPISAENEDWLKQIRKEKGKKKDKAKADTKDKADADESDGKKPKKKKASVDPYFDKVLSDFMNQ